MTNLAERFTDAAWSLWTRVSGVERMSRADRERWAACRSLADVGELTAQWLEGRIAARPGYCGPVDVDEDEAAGLTDALVAANRVGFVTDSSQAGCDVVTSDGNYWQQYAAVVGFAAPQTVDWLTNTVVAPVADDGTAVDTGLRMVRCEQARRFGWDPVDPVTFHNGVVVTDFANRYSGRDLRDTWTGYGICHPHAVEELVAAEQIVIRDTEFGRNDRLWPALHAAATNHQENAETAAATGEHVDDAADGDVTAVGEYKPTFQWHADPAWDLADQMHFSRQLQAGQIVAGDIETFFQTSWPQMWQEAAQTWNTTPQEIRDAVRAYGRWLTAVADHDQATDESSAAGRVAGDAATDDPAGPSDVDNDTRDDGDAAADGM